MNERKIHLKLKAVTILALCLSLVASGLIGAAIAKYISSITGSSSTDVAVWSIEVNDQQVASSETQMFTFDLYDTLYEEDLSTPETHVSAGVIAPGTGGAFTLKVENLSQVDAEFTLMLTEGNEKNIPIQYSTDRTTWLNDLTSLRYLFTEFFLERETGVASKTIYWRWCYTGSGTSHLGQTDDSDTALGFLALTEDVKLTITANLTVGQYVPRPEAPAQDLLSAAEITDTSITLQTIEGAEYSMDGITWQDSPTFTGLTSGTEYTLYVRYKETANDLASKSSSIKLNTTITYTDFVVTVENRHKIGFTNQTTDLVIPETFYDEEDGKWYRVVAIADGDFVDETAVFYYCKNLLSVTLPDSITHIGVEAFKDCSNLTTVNLGTGVETIGSAAFSGCASLTDIALPDSITSIGALAFINCAVTSVTIPDSLSNIGRWFVDCYDLTEITFGDGVTSIEEGAFSVYSDTLDEPIPTTIHGGNSVVYSYDWAGDNRTVEFTGVEYTDFTVTQENRHKIGYDSYSSPNLNIPTTFYDEEDGVWYKVTAIGDVAFYEGSLSGSLTIPEGVTSIGANAFESCGITSVYLPDSITSIGEDAFYNCGGPDIYYAGTEEQWNAIEFGYGWEGIEKPTVHIPTDFVITYSNRHKIGYTGVQNENLVIPKAFFDEEDQTWYRVVGFETIWDEDAFDDIGAFTDCNYLNSVTIPNSITSIPNATFANCTSLQKVIIPDSVEYIGAIAFQNCTKLNYLVIPDSVTSIWDSAFANCNSLTEITFGSGLATCGEFNHTVFHVETATPLHIIGGNDVVRAYDWASDNRNVTWD